ncbi:hypothetical protein BDR03DRAFT_987634 [Suillus americanus]|nr:hypothetical protein BDR03DRAFT_987634 [Suillus americanus]
MHVLLYNGLTIVELPYYAVDLEVVAFALLAAPYHLLDDSANTEFQESLHLFHSLQHLTVSPLQPTAMEVITSLPSLESLSVMFQLQWKLEIVEYLKTLDMVFRSANNLQCPRFGSYKGTTWDSWTSKGPREFHGVFHKDKVEVENQMWHHPNFGQ